MSSINIQLYSSCNCNCSFCRFKDKNFKKINPNFVLNFLKNHNEMDYIVITGGEPTFAIEEYCQIIDGLSNSNKTTVLQTNGWWGNNDKIKNEIKNHPPKIVHLSVDSEKQKYIDIEVVISAYNFLISNNIKTFVVNHHIDEAEYEYYKKIFPNIKYGKITPEEKIPKIIGPALLASNNISNVNTNGWGDDKNGI